MHRAALIAIFAAGFIYGQAASLTQNRTTPGEFLTELPTLVSLGFEWRITGDDNRNAQVNVSYRKPGEAQWRPALPMLRLQHEQVTGGGNAPTYRYYTAPKMSPAAY